jgi:hypothetical protein
MAISERERRKKINDRLTVGVSSATTATKSQTTPSRRKRSCKSKARGWQGGALPAYLVPQEASQSHQTAMTTHAVETEEHHEKQGHVCDKCADGAEFDALHVEYTVLYIPVPGRVKLQIRL